MREKKKILIVDDDPLMTDLISEFCRELGYEVKAVNQSPLAAATAKDWRPNLITLDLDMPEMDGLEILKSLRADPQTQGIPVLIISARVREAEIPSEAVQGLFDKPIPFSTLLGQINRLLQPAL
jgi:CheY-like chemotaxis protein